ncbi:helix-turn-helix domain-containing protein [Azospirillum sp. B4]|uniref:MerR family transcriptional regulator n=1 Tax=Azospirillum sp. B4 TaxID=95605 RepID=UPI00067860BE|nr:helix-turn-helix domain-containing protein [Azospirillum sp. B4]
MVSSGIYTAETLALRAGIPLRTVRFYVQEKLIDPPLGRGPGAHFTEHHLHQLQQARTLQNSGLSLDEIRERKGDLILGLQVTSVWDALLHRNSPDVAHDSEADNELDPSKCIRIPMADGVELLVSEETPLPSPKQLVEIAMQIRRLFRQK